MENTPKVLIKDDVSIHTNDFVIYRGMLYHVVSKYFNLYQLKGFLSNNLEKVPRENLDGNYLIVANRLESMSVDYIKDE